MSKELLHIEASRSWWNGSAKTLCGIKIPKPETVWFSWLSSKTKCPTCENLNK